MACAAMATAVPFGLRYSPSCSFMAQLSRGSVQLAQFNRPNSLRLSSSHSISGLASLLPHRLCTIASSPLRPLSLTIVSAKGYKMKTHKASAQRVRVTGRGKIVRMSRRRAGKQHLLVKKNAKRRTRLSKMHEVSRSDYNNVIGALPYLKVNRKAE
ncbi:PREDICTED: 50S ribosomal protein L35, chloroplastic [Prunus mume]|uniref:50S ribosomal protein L35 n=1 Tax=Prunus mume TaxID=102107 RepID=A0ABM0NEJ0_PRUMU|nr:PREDICTED: 50S ribosomal protein L35, chloroplastic [Prunus mume]